MTCQKQYSESIAKPGALGSTQDCKANTSVRSCYAVQTHYSVNFHPFSSVLLLKLPISNWGQFYCLEFCSGATSHQLLMLTHSFLYELIMSTPEHM